MSTDEKKEKNARLDKTWKEIFDITKAQQQEYYECSAEWTKYLEKEYGYLKQNIGYAMFGPPTGTAKNDVGISEKIDVVSKNSIIDAICYQSKAEKQITIVYNQVLKFGRDCIKKSCIYYGLIYNVTFPTKIQLEKIIQSDSKAKDEAKDEEIQLFPTPIFKIRRPRHSTDGEIWYIDMCGRVYKNWTDYITHNTLPKCTMVLPKNGLYQPDRSCEITEEYSTVWLEVLESPACDTASAILNGADKASSVVGVAGLGLGIASLFTPLAPVTVGAVVASTISGLWTIGRSTHSLIDKNSHEESIADRNAFPAWLAIGGGAIGIVASGGNVLLTTVTRSGGTVSKAAQVVYNSLLLGNVGVNGFGLGYQAYCMYEKYQEKGEIETVDVVFFAAHLLFFGNAVVNLQFAGEIIESTQGKVLEDYRATLRSKNLRRQFNRAKRTAAANNVDRMSEQAEVIRYINRKYELRANNPNYTQNNTQNSSESNPKIGKTHIGSTLYEMIKINDISFIKPMVFVQILLELDESDFQGNNSENSTLDSTGDGDATSMFVKLKDLLLTLLTQLSSGNGNTNVHIPSVTNFYGTLDDMKYIKNALVILPVIFKIAQALANKNSRLKCIDKALHFTWNFIKVSAKQNNLGALYISDEKMQDVLNRMISGLIDCIDDIVSQLIPAFAKYISKYLEMAISYLRSSIRGNETLNIDGIHFIKPTKFVQLLLEIDQNPSYKNNSERTTSCSTKDEAAEHMLSQLSVSLVTLSMELCLENVESDYAPEMTKFDNIFNDMKYLKNAPEIFRVTFKIGTTLAKDSLCLGYMYEAIHFTWNYVKENLNQTSSGTFCINDEKAQNELNRMMTVLTNNKDKIIRELLPAFEEYIAKSLETKFS